MQDGGDGMVFIQPAEQLIASLRVVDVDQGLTSRRKLLQLHMSTNELRTRMDRLPAGPAHLEVQLHMLDGATLHVRTHLSVLPGASGVKPKPLPGEDAALLDQSGHSSGGPLGGHRFDDSMHVRTKASPEKLHLQWIVFVVVGPMLVMPVLASIIMIASWRRFQALKRAPCKPETLKRRHTAECAASTLGLSNPPAPSEVRLQDGSVAPCMSGALSLLPQSW
jgi:hypothetical protein